MLWLVYMRSGNLFAIVAIVELHSLKALRIHVDKLALVLFSVLTFPSTGVNNQEVTAVLSR